MLDIDVIDGKFVGSRFYLIPSSSTILNSDNNLTHFQQPRFEIILLDIQINFVKPIAVISL